MNEKKRGGGKENILDIDVQFNKKTGRHDTSTQRSRRRGKGITRHITVNKMC